MPSLLFFLPPFNERLLNVWHLALIFAASDQGLLDAVGQDYRANEAKEADLVSVAVDQQDEWVVEEREDAVVEEIPDAVQNPDLPEDPLETGGDDHPGCAKNGSDGADKFHCN